MEITEVRIKLMEDSDDRLQAFCSITFDNAFVVRDLKIIEGSSGPFVAMPSRKLTSHCHQCGSKNHLKAGYCNHCGARQREDRLVRDQDGRAKLYADIAHPINSACREAIQSRVIQEFRVELERAKQPGYVSRYDEDYDDEFDPSYMPSEDKRVARPSAGNIPAPPAAPVSASSPLPGSPPIIMPAPIAPAPTTHLEPADPAVPPPHLPVSGTGIGARTIPTEASTSSEVERVAAESDDEGSGSVPPPHHLSREGHSRLPKDRAPREQSERRERPADPRAPKRPSTGFGDGVF